MRRHAVGLVLVLCATCASILAQAPPDPVVLRLDPALDAIVAPDARLEVLKDGFGLIEAPVWMKDDRGAGYLVFSDMAANAIYKWAPAAGVATYLEQAGFTGTDTSTLYPGRIGPNGMALDREGRLVVCAHGDRSLFRLNKDGSRTVLADRFEGKRLNGPNDVVMKSDGSFYFTDRGSGLKGPEIRELPYRAVFRLKDGKLDIVVKDDDSGARANGLAFSPDEKLLYITDEGRIKRFDVLPNGMVTNGRVFFDKAGQDGMKIDARGNLYVTGSGGVWIIDAAGKHLGTIRTGGNTNMTFGEDGKTLFITGNKVLYRIRLNTSGI